MFPAFSAHYASLPDRMRAEMSPTPVSSPRLLAFNRPLAEALGLNLDALDDHHLAEVLGGNLVPEGARPVATAYAGHQFGNFVPQLGDGRALLLGELTHRDGTLREVQLKGAGRTPFSRGGDGRAPLGPVLREYLVSEAMAALGVPTTRALAAVASGDSVVRQMVEPGAVLTRVATSHIRVGTFQYFAARRDTEALSLLVDFCIERHYPHLAKSAPHLAESAPQPAESTEGGRALALLDAVVERQASLIAQWKGLGFIHGVMNTDNCAISGETIDYGPCAFMDAFHPHRVFSSIDERGRYAWDNQPAIAQWNLARLAETLLPLIDDDQERAVALATASIEKFAEQHDAAWTAVLRAKLGLDSQDDQSGDHDLALGEDLLKAMEEGNADFTLGFARLSAALEDGDETLAEGFERRHRLDDWLPRWRQRLQQQGVGAPTLRQRLSAANPLVIPRNHLVEKAIRAAVDDDDLSVFSSVLAAVTRPHEAPSEAWLMAPPTRDERVLRTFCGT
ncbi:protein adenylyltransferase SelO [Halomonas denitrificans]|uniref:protein adenylyltransferase SelO n=1 Tax=Halomonas denitrificans TaxID=370769 RepID=UPI001C9A15EE|nr:YdiU family protein [Halomonas denitrificans]MBY5968613.1 YdiU family protein [Halomonas denitrificans]